MRFVDDENLSFCLTISTGIKRETMLEILGQREALPNLQTFNDFAWETHQPGLNGLLNVFTEGEDFLVTVENNGFLGVAYRTIRQVKELGGVNHYVAVYHSSGGNDGFQYVEVQDGTTIANFDPRADEAPDAVADFFHRGDSPRATRYGLIKAVEYRMSEPDRQFEVREEWLEDPTTTYLIDYRTDRTLKA